MRPVSIGIVVPSLNQGGFLAEALESIFRQDYPNLEVVVMDGGSTDESVNIIRSYQGRLKYWQSQPDGGQSAAINEGVRRLTSELVGWLNSDDFYWRDSLWAVARAYQAHPNRGLYIGNGFRYNQSDGTFRPFCVRHVAFNRDALTNGLDYVLQPSTFFLRQAWKEVDGLDTSLDFTMDWDAVLRIAERRTAVLINEFLAVSREYEQTKSSRGAMRRAEEISRVVRKHAGREITPGNLYYLLETLLGLADEAAPHVREHLWAAMQPIRGEFARRWENADSFPEISDDRDSVYLPFATSNALQRPMPVEANAPPSISIVMPSFNQAQFLLRALDSVFNQSYPRLEFIIYDGGSTDGSSEILRRRERQLTYWVSEPDRGPSDAINKGLKRATGEILGWLSSDDMLSAGALWEVAEAFAADPSLDLVYGNALYIDDGDRLFLADHSSHKTGLYYGAMQPRQEVPWYWRYVHAIPQPTVFFRRRLLESCGYLDESYRFIFDFELFNRFAAVAKVKKLERVQAFYRIHSSGKSSDWNQFLIELYRFSRPHWPQRISPRFYEIFWDYLRHYLKRRFGGRPRNYREWAESLLVSASLLTKIGNPEKIGDRFVGRAKPQRAASATTSADAVPAVSLNGFHHIVERKPPRYRSLFCSLLWPRHPGRFGGEIRDFHLLRHLLSISTMEFFSLHSVANDGREDFLAPYLEGLHTSDTIRSNRPDLVRPLDANGSLTDRLIRTLRQRQLPVLGTRYHWDPLEHLPLVSSSCGPALQERLKGEKFDFLFVSPQPNPVALTLDTAQLQTRLIMSSYDVEALRVRSFADSEHGLSKLALRLEAGRAARFESDNLARYDGVIAVSEQDREYFIEEYGFAAERVLTLENGVDSQYFAFNERTRSDRPHIVFVGTLSYLPNRQAAWRLIREIMPLVRRKYPDACLWIVGQGPEESLRTQSDGSRTVVTGTVDDVRPYLARATVSCVPLISGSGTKYKVLEALSAGVPMVCSPLAIDGLGLEDGRHLLVGRSDEELATAIILMIGDEQRAARIARQGREEVERRFAWPQTLSRLDDWLSVMADLPRRQGHPTTS